MALTNEERDFYRVSRTIRKIKAGALTADLMEDGSLRSLRCGETVLLRQLYAAVRDENWRTIPPVLSDWEIREEAGACFVRFRAEHREGEVHFRWTGDIAIREDGTLSFGMDGEALKDFRRNRIGFCLLHPIEMAGKSVRLDTPDGAVDRVFPELISPEDPFKEMLGMTASLDNGASLELRFEGDLFQTEDQRNWTDGSYKTFCTPLRLPLPVTVGKGTTIQQRVELRFVPGDPVEQADQEATAADSVVVGAEAVGRLPRIGTTLSPETGSVPSDRLTEQQRELNWADLRVALRLDDPEWRSVLAGAAQWAKAFGTRLHLELIVSYDFGGLEQFVEELLPVADQLTGISIYPASIANAQAMVETRCILSGASLSACQYTTTSALLAELRRALAEAGVDAEVGGGSRGNFSEWNRSALPLAEMDFTEFGINPQIHAADLLSIVETLPAQLQAALTAIDVAGPLPVRIGHIALRQDFNPYAVNDQAVQASNDRKLRYDARLATPFGAAWTLGSLGQLAVSGVDAVRYHEHAGSLGLTDADGRELYPVYALFRQLAAFRDSEVLKADYDPYSLGVLALRKDGKVSVFVANLTEASRTIVLSGAGMAGLSVSAAARQIGVEGGAARVGNTLDSGVVALTLEPFQTVIVERR